MSPCFLVDDTIVLMSEDATKQKQGYYHPDETGSDSGGATASWRGPEFVDHHKSSAWMLMLVVVSVLVVTLVYLLTRDVLSIVVISVLAVIFAISAVRSPKTVNYSVDVSGITVDQKKYPYSDFRAFSVYDDGGVDSLILMPTKRWMIPLTVCVPKEGLSAVTELIGSRVPIEKHSFTFIDSILQRIRF